MLVCSVQTDGINIDEMLQYDKILDLRRLSCNNVHVMARYLFVPSHRLGAILYCTYNTASAKVFRISIHSLYADLDPAFPQKVLEPDPEVLNGLLKKIPTVILFLNPLNFSCYKKISFCEGKKLLQN
jgi:hypothetical protein